MTVRSLAILLFVAATVLYVRSNDTTIQAAQNVALEKIAPWVLDQTHDGKHAEFLVVLADQADLNSADLLRTKQEKARFVYSALWGKAQDTQKPLLGWLQANKVEHRAYYIINMIWVRGDRSLALTLAARVDVARIEGNPSIHNNLEQLAQASPEQVETIEANITNTRAPEVWAMGFTGQGVVVAGADTGYRWDHNTLRPHYRGWNGMSANHDFNWHDSIHSGGGSCGANSAQPCDDSGHGTHTIGTAVGDDGSGNQIGMAPGAKWIGCRNMNQGNGTPATYIECMEFFLAPYPVSGTPAQGDPDKAPDITTNSWTCPPSEGCASGTLQQAVEAQRAAGILMVVAAGNSGSGCSTVVDPPSQYDASYTVGAFSHTTNTIAGFSSRGPVTIDGSNRLKPDITAPGVSIRSAWNSSTTAYNTISGTSMATPHVAGATALLWSAQPALRNAVSFTEQILNNSAVHVSSTACSSSGVPNNTYGYGRLDIKTAVDAALPCTSLPTLSKSSQPFPTAGGADSVNVVSVTGCGWVATINASWIIINSGSSGTGNGTVNYSVTANAGAGRSGTMIIAGRTFTVNQAGPNGFSTPYDYDLDHKSDIAVWRPSSGSWLALNSSTDGPASPVGWGVSGDVIVPGDYDGDGKTEIAVWRPSNGTWFIIYSSNGSQQTTGWGVNGDVAVPADYDGDGKTDIAVWRPSEGRWYIRQSSNGQIRLVVWGINGDAPVAADYDGDGKADIAVWRPSNGTWYVINSSDSSISVTGWGMSGDVAVPGDYTGDGKADLAVWRSSNGTWYVFSSSGPAYSQLWGTSGDVPVPADYDGDGKIDVAVWRSSNGTWFIVNSSNGSIGTTGWGVTGDVPVPSAYNR